MAYADLIKSMLDSKELIYGFSALIILIKIFSTISREHRKTRSKIYELSLLINKIEEVAKK